MSAKVKQLKHIRYVVDEAARNDMGGYPDKHLLRIVRVLDQEIYKEEHKQSKLWNWILRHTLFSKDN